MNNYQRVAVSVKDSTAKLIMGLLVDVGLPFEYRKAPGQTMAAVVSVAERNGPTLLKVREVIEDRQERAQVRSRAHETPISSAQIMALAAKTDAQLFDEAHKGFDLPDPKMPPGYELMHVKDPNQWHWARPIDEYVSGAYPTASRAAAAAWAHHF